ncbi:MAG: hypothetical protein EA397_09380 [Deltaproteobacteria bacterium]|nr:MAG: hypothetical protein EA397_09380 [Deltaproteobacteria bacterium]
MAFYPILDFARPQGALRASPTARLRVAFYPILDFARPLGALRASPRARLLVAFYPNGRASPRARLRRRQADIDQT